jgi:protein-disulfide isomerase
MISAGGLQSPITYCSTDLREIVLMALRGFIGGSPAIGGIILALVFNATAKAARCRPPSSEKIALVRSYIGELDNPGVANDLSIGQASRVPGACLWMLHFESSSEKKQITVYLSSDQDHFYRDVYDLRTDPLADQRTREQKLMNALAAGSPPSRGSATADVTIVEFADFECPYCRRMGDALANQANVKTLFRNFPLPIHPWANVAAQMGECAALQNTGAFWSLHDFFFANQEILNQNNVYQKVNDDETLKPNLDMAQFKNCVDQHLSDKLIKNDVDLGRKNYVSGTPTLFVNGVRYEGYRDAEQLRAIIEAARRGDVWPVPPSIRIQSSLPSAAGPRAGKE